LPLVLEPKPCIYIHLTTAKDTNTLFFMQKIKTDVFDPIQSETVSESVVRQIEEAILSGILIEGGKLPTERELAAQLNVSRPKVRDALQELERRDLISIRHGDGAYVQELTASAMSPALVALYLRHPLAVYDHLEYRQQQEAFASKLAAERATDTDRQIIRTIVNEMTAAQSNKDHELGAALDAKFHKAILNASHNRTLIHMMNSLYQLNRGGVFFSRKNVQKIETVTESLLHQHQDLATAICDGDAVSAYRFATDHISYVTEQLVENLKQKKREEISKKRAKAFE